MKGKRSVFITEPYLLSLHPDREMHVVWIQRQEASGVVHFSETPALGQSVTAECYPLNGLRYPAEGGYDTASPERNPPVQLWQCIAVIRSLRPGQRIFYRCGCLDEETEIYEFHAAPPSGAPFRIAQISDLQGYLPCDESVLHIGRQQPDLLLYSGDAAFFSWRADQWFDQDADWQEPDAAKRAFFPCMQQQNGARLMQYCPTFFCPGNHEVDDFRVGTDPVFTRNADNWHFSIFMQIFRPLYPKADYSLSGKRWYSADYGDLHLVSLSIQRWALWGAYEVPGWRLVDPISPDSPQIRWLTDDLAACRSKYRWVIQHWHILNKGTDVQPNLCQPQLAEDGSVSYPDDDGSALMALYSRFGVNAVTFGHSHVYERYYYHGCHYIEAAYLGVCCRERNAPLHPSRLQPLVEDNSRQSFLIVDCDESGLHARGFYSAEAPILFDEYQIADADGKTVAPAL